MDRKKLNKILNALDGTDADFTDFDKQVEVLKGKLKEKITSKTLDDVNFTLDQFRKKIDLTPLTQSIENIKGDYGNKISELSTSLEEKIKEFEQIVSQGTEQSASHASQLKDEITELKHQISVLNENQTDEIKSLESKLPDLSKVEEEIRTLRSLVNVQTNTFSKDLTDLEEKSKKELIKQIETFRKDLEDTRRELINKINQKGGGNANRNILVGNNPSVLSKYTDLNIKAGTNITLSYQNNETLKTTDLTITSSGGSGTSRSISTVSVSSVIGATAGTDYVLLCNQGIKLTLPTAVGNSNLYTIKNTGASSVLVVTTGVETIDGDTTIIMPIRYTAVDLISDTANWHIT